MHRLAGALALAIPLAACSSPAPDLRPTPPRTTLKDCGKETIVHGSGYDAAARECIWQAYVAREPAEFTTTHTTIEGDPIVYKVQITPKGYTVTVDSKDRYSAQGVFTHTCEAFERIRQDDHPDRFGFALSKCTGGGKDRIAVP